MLRDFVPALIARAGDEVDFVVIVLLALDDGTLDGFMLAFGDALMGFMLVFGGVLR